LLHSLGRKEDALRRFELVVEQSRDAILFLRRDDGRLLYANPAAETAYGYSRDELLALTIFDLRAFDGRPAVEAQMQTASASGVLFESWHRRKDGSRFPVEVSSRGVKVEGAELLVSVVRDITERKRAEEALRRSESRYRLLHESLRDGFVQVDMDGRILEFNEAYRELLGYPAEELRRATYAELTPERWHAMEERLVREQIVPRGYSDVYQKEYRRADGSIVPVELRTVLARDDAGQPIAMWAIVRDVTERKRAEEAVRQADRQKTEFLAVLSHELRNPLAPIRNSLHLLEHAPRASPVAERAIRVLHRQVGQLARLVDDLLDLNRISHGKIQLQPARLDARDVVARVCDDARPGFEDRGVALVDRAHDEPLWLDADATRLAQMVGNLLSNALKFTPSGGEVRVTVARQGDRCEIAVRDTGAGIAPADLERIFDPFVQAERTREQRHGGLGIGLALVRDLVRQHGGEIRAASDGPGRGATFVLDLPLAPAPATAVPAGPEPGAPGPLDILVVEDNEDARESLADLLTLSGHHVRLAASGRAGLTAAAAAPPDVLLCDLGLPDVSGLEVIQRLRTAGSAVFAVALTGYAQPDDRRLALSAGFDAHLSKPPELEELARLLRRAGATAAPRPPRDR
jgi:PAS domain S-box-containing protein